MTVTAGPASRTIASGLARVLLASIFVIGGVDALRRPASTLAAAGWFLEPIVRRTPAVPDTDTVVRSDGAAKVVGGLAPALGVYPRAVALGLAASLVPTTVAGHAFWAQQDPPTRDLHKAQFIKNASLLGGLLAVATGPKRVGAGNQVIEADLVFVV